MANEHKLHNVLGGYCFTCRLKTQANIPGWKRPSKGPSVGYSVWEKSNITGQGYTTAVIWANGDIDKRRDQGECGLCGLYCKYPVSRNVTNKGDSYKEIRKSFV